MVFYSIDTIELRANWDINQQLKIPSKIQSFSTVDSLVINIEGKIFPAVDSLEINIEKSTLPALDSLEISN